MPARASASARSSRAPSATASRKSSTPAPRTRTSAGTAHVEVPDEGPTTSLRTRIVQIFADAQKTNATQRKSVVHLRKIQEACCYEPQNPKQQQFEDFDEGHFNEEVGRCMLRVLGVKKSEPIGDRIVRFLSLFLRRANEEDFRIHGVDEETTEIPETPSSRLTTHIINLLLREVNAKDKTVRFRAVQTIAHVVAGLNQIDDELFSLIKATLSKRLRDKEPPVRVHSVLGFIQIIANEDPENEDDDSDEELSGSTLYKLLDIMQNDPSAEVRRTILLNLDFKPIVIKFMLERARDSDVVTRRALYARLLPAMPDFRYMSLIEREKLIRWGLTDRDEAVRKSTARLFREEWLETCAKGTKAVPEGNNEPVDVEPPSMDALLELLERVDVTRSGAEGGMAHEAMRVFWEGRPDYREYVTFDDDFWNDLTPESAFVVRSLNDFCLTADNGRFQELIDEKMPTVKELSYFIKEHLNRLIIARKRIAEVEEPTQEQHEEYDSLEFIVEQLLHIALTLDYTDEIGRRQISIIMRDAISLPQLPEDCTRLAVQVLRTTCGPREVDERDFCNVILEAIAEVRDTLNPEEAEKMDDDESFHSAQSDISERSSVEIKPRKPQPIKQEDEEAEEDRHFNQILVYAKCLHIAECALENVYCEMVETNNTALVNILNTLIVPACQNHNPLVRELGLKCLALCALLNKNVASENMMLFIVCFTKGHEEMQIICLQAITDIIAEHPSLLDPTPADPNTTADADAEATPSPWLKPITKAFLKAFQSPSKALSQVACHAAAKLLLHDFLPTTSASDILKAFTVAYFNPENTRTNPGLSQALAYCIPVFCHSRQKNALLMAQVAVPAIHKLVNIRDALEVEEAEDMVTWPIIAAHIAEWTDGRRVVVFPEVDLNGKPNVVEGAEEPHLFLAGVILERVLNHGCGRDEKKPLLTLLGKLHISSSPEKKVAGSGYRVDEEMLRTLHGLASEAVEGNVGTDATTRNVISKIETALTKRLGDVEVTQIQDQDEEELAEEMSVLSVAGARKEQTEGGDEIEEEEEEEEDTMLAGMQGEGTRMPLEDEDEDMDSDGTIVGRRSERAGTEVGVTESDIVDSLLESEMDE